MSFENMERLSQASLQHKQILQNCHTHACTIGIGTHFMSTSGVLNPGIGTDTGIGICALLKKKKDK